MRRVLRSALLRIWAELRPIASPVCHLIIVLEYSAREAPAVFDPV